MAFRIETKRLILISCNEEILNAVLAGDNEVERLLKIKAAHSWTEFGEPPFRYALQRIASNPDEEGWWTYLPVLKSENVLIGSGGYKGKPTSGMVEIGYEIAKSYRNRGLATEMAQALIDQAFKSDVVTIVIAHTLAEDNASVKVLRKCGMKFTGEINDPDDGMLWRWELRKSP